MEIIFTIFIEIGQDLVGRNKVEYFKNAWVCIGTEVINSKHIQTNRDYSLVGSLDNISGPVHLIYIFSINLP